MAGLDSFFSWGLVEDTIASEKPDDSDWARVSSAPGMPAALLSSVLPHYCTAALAPCVLPRHYTSALAPCALPHYCTAALVSNVLPRHCTAALAPCVNCTTALLLLCTANARKLRWHLTPPLPQTCTDRLAD